MPTKYDQPHYYYKDTAALDGMCEVFGNYLERLSAVEKFDLIALLALWQSYDTQEQSQANNPVSLHQYLAINSEMFQGYSNNIDHALRILEPATDGDAIALLQSMSSQLSSGVYAA